MGIYIPEMTMPRNCYDCQIESYVPNCPVYMYYSATEYLNDRHPDCPLVDVITPHGSLIDFDTIYFIEDDCGELIAQFSDLKDVPSVIEAEREQDEYIH